jgi:hypothetical protein
MSTLRLIAVAGTLLALIGCGQFLEQRNPFLTATETYGASFLDEAEEAAGGAGVEAEVEFRQPMTVTLANNATDEELNVRFAAWVKVSSLRNADQQDALLADGFVQLTREVRLGTAFTLVPGTFVYNGPGTAGATMVRIEPGVGDEEEGVQPSTVEFELITPDVILLFMEPPVSCESVAFTFTEEGFSVDESLNVRATGPGGRKTLAQVDVYQCDPLEPGLFLKAGGGARHSNEYFEGDNVRIDFRRIPDENDYAAFVTVGDTGAAGTIP